MEEYIVGAWGTAVFNGRRASVPTAPEGGPEMAKTSDTPVLDTLAAMTIDSIENCGMDANTLILTRMAALVAMDAPAISYLAHIDPAMRADLTAEQLQDVLVAIAPVVGTARVMSAATHISEALGIGIAVAGAEAEAMAENEARSRGTS